MVERMDGRDAFRFQARIRFVDTDASGRIHYTAMFRYFEAAEVEFLRTLGVTYDMRRDYTLPRVHVECDYLKGIVHDDLIDIKVSLASMGRASIRFAFETYKDGELAAKGAIVAVCVDRKTMQTTALPDELRQRLEPAVKRELGAPRGEGR